jgi:uridine phosphorylase
LNFYRRETTIEEDDVLQQFTAHTQIGSTTNPYMFSAGTSLLKHFVKDYHQGITVTCPGFYGPQGRVLRLGLTQPQLIDRLTEFQYGPYRITNFEMETSAIYGLGKLLGHSCLSLNAIVANRVKKTFSKDGAAAVDQLIQNSLQIIAGI